MDIHGVKCKTCSEIVALENMKDTKGHCYECWMEIRYGILIVSNSSTLGGSPHYTREDESPWQENAIGYMEDGE